MRKLNYLLLGAAAIAMASCSQDDILNGGADDGLYHINVKLPTDVATRALGNGLTANNLYMAVYDADANNALIYDDLTLTFKGQISTEVALSLVKGKSYNIAFFALSPEAAEQGVYTFDSTNGQFKVDYSKMENDPNNADAYDCFFRLYNISDYSGATQSAEVLLNRPVAQVNWGTNDLTEEYPAILDHYGIGGEYIVTGINTQAYNTWDFFAGTDGSGNAVTTGTDAMSTVVLNAFTPPTEGFPVEGYDYVAMNYLLAPESETLYNLTLTISNAGNEDATDETIFETVVNVDNAPVQANYRTNIYGSLLSEDLVLTVTKDKVWGTPDYEVIFIDGVAYTVVKNDDQTTIRLGGNVILGEDYVYQGSSPASYLLINKNTNLDLNGFTLSSDRPGTYNATMVVNKGDVTISNGTILPLASDDGATTSTIYLNGASSTNLTLDNVTVYGGHPIWMKSSASTVTINSGTYYSTYQNSPTVYVEKGGQVTINGGTFGQAGVTPSYLLNILDSFRETLSDPRDAIIVYGGTFINFDPANCVSEGIPTNFVAEGYKSVASTNGNDTYYTVVPNDALVVDGTTTSLADALSEAKDGDTILVGAGVMATPADFNKSVTIKGLGAETSILQANNAYWSSSNGATVTFEDVQLKSFVNNTNHTSMGFNGGGKQTYTNVIFDGEFHVFTGSATFTNCGFNYYGITGNNYQLWCQTDGPIVIDNCSMACNGSKAILVYGDQKGETGGNITINGLKVTNSGSVGDKALVEIHSENYVAAGTITLSNITYEASQFPAGLWQEIYNVDPYKGQATDYYKVIVNGQEEQKGGYKGAFTGN